VSAIETKISRIELVEGRIVVARISDAVQTLEDARENFTACRRLAQPGPKPVLVDIRAARPLSPEVRHLYMGESLDSSFAALALLVRGTPLGLMVGNVYLRIARPGIPTRIFADERKALDWLRGAR
jgi:hypothetical protein